MTSRDFVQAEAANTDRIVLYREGLFWKAYERSAFAVCSQIRSFKPTKRSLKTLGGGELISIGFLTRTEDTVLEGLERLEVGPERLELRAASPIDTVQFEAWKASVPLAPSRPVRAAEPAPQSGSPAPSGSVGASAGLPQSGASVPAPAYAGIPARQECNPVTGLPVIDRADVTTACRVADALKNFDLASKTPMECMLFVSELQKLLFQKR